MRLQHGMSVVAVATLLGGGFACGTSFVDSTPSPVAGDARVESDASSGTDATESSRSDGASVDSGGDSAVPFVDTLTGNRDRLLASYLVWLKANPAPQVNGLAGADLPDTCELWNRLVPSGQSVFLTLTARIQGSKLGSDGKSLLWHVTEVYKIVGGSGATKTEPGSCGGEGNRMFMSIDLTAHRTLLLVNTNKGGNDPTTGKPDLADIPAGAVWHDSRDFGGAHAPFDLSDETEKGAPRGQVHFFRDPASALATKPFGKSDLQTLVDGYALEMDQDYDWSHNSNPLCSYTTYGALCFPQPSRLGAEIYVASYGNFDPTFKPASCAGK